MKLIGWIIIFVLGIAIINVLSPRVKLLEKIGFSLPVGIGVSTLIMMLMELIGIPINNIGLILGLNVAVILGLGAYIYFKNRALLDVRPIIETCHPRNLLPINLGLGVPYRLGRLCCLRHCFESHVLAGVYSG